MPDIRTDILPMVGVKPGTPEARTLVSFVTQRRAACINSLARPIRLAAACRKIATWGEEVDWPEDCRTIVHKIRQVIETQVANHLKEPAKSTLEPLQPGGYAKWYWCGPEEAAQEISVSGFPIDPLYLGAVLPSGQIVPPLPLPMAMVKLYKQLSQADPDIFDPQFICRADDEYTANAFQKQLDADWLSGRVPQWLRATIYGFTVEGWQLRLVESDNGQLLPRYTSIEQMYIAQDCETIDDATEAGADLYVDLDEAMAQAKTKEVQDAILGNQTTNSLSAPLTGGNLPAKYKGNFGRPMLPKVVWWLCNQPMPVPMSPEEAVNGGHVQQRPVDMGLGASRLDGNTAPVASNTGGDVIGSEMATSQPSLEEGSGVAGGQPGLPVQVAYALPTGEPVDPSHPQWPTKTVYVLRQVTIINDQLVEDIKCKWPIIPIIQFRNSLVIGRPWGVGEPFYTKNLQETITKIAQAGSDHIEYNAHPAKTMPEGLKQSMEKEFGEAFIRPDQIIGMPSPFDVMPTSPIKIVEPAPFPESNLRILDFTNQMFNEAGGHPDVMSGNSPSASASGELVANLQSAAVEPLNFKAQDIGFALERFTRLALHNIVNFKSIQEVSDTTGVPIPLLSILYQRIIGRSPRAKITISSGAGATMERKRAQYIQWNQVISPDDGMPIVDGDTTRDACGVDAQMVKRRSEAALRGRAQVTAPLQGQVETAANPQPTNGNGGRFGGH